MKEVDVSRCYGCGVNNPIGFHLKSTFREGRSHIEFDVLPEHGGYPGLMHGGITGVLFDEVMYHAIPGKDVQVVLVNMNIDYRSPALVGDHLVCEGWVTKEVGRKVDVTATIVNARNGAVVADATGKFVKVDLEKLLSDQKKSPG